MTSTKRIEIVPNGRTCTGSGRTWLVKRNGAVIGHVNHVPALDMFMAHRPGVAQATRCASVEDGAALIDGCTL